MKTSLIKWDKLREELLRIGVSEYNVGLVGEAFERCEE